MLPARRTRGRLGGVRRVRADHRCKTAFLAAFESVATLAGHKEPPSFLERAKERWGVKRGGGRS